MTGFTYGQVFLGSSHEYIAVLNPDTGSVIQYVHQLDDNNNAVQYITRRHDTH